MNCRLLLITCLVPIYSFAQFGSVIDVTPQIQIGWDVQIGDLHGDGLDDIIVSHQGGLSMIKNLGGNEFALPVLLIPESYMPRHVTLIDTDGSGGLDIVFHSDDDHKVYLCLSQGESCGEPQAISAELDNISEIFAQKMSGDENPDLLVCFNDSLSLYAQIEGEFQLQSNPIWQSDISYFHRCVGDFTNDGQSDMVMCDNDSVYYFVNDGQGDFDVLSIWENTNSLKDCTTRDVDGDGWLDIIGRLQTELSSTYHVAWSQNQEGEGFAEPSVMMSYIYFVSTFCAPDLDGDGDGDLVVGTYSSDEFWWCENLGDGSFGPKLNFSDDFFPVHAVACSDLNQDGLEDVVGVGYSCHQVGLLTSLGDGNVEFAELNSSTYCLLNQIGIADIDDDGLGDILAVDRDELNWHENEADFNFTTGVGLNSSESSVDYMFRTADVNLDGTLDLIAAGNELLWFQGLGDGQFGGINVLDELNGQVRHLQIIDVTDDLFPEIIVATSSSTIGIRIYENVDGNTFTYFDNVLGGEIASDFRICDFDGDALHDLMYTQSSSDDFFFMQGDGLGGFVDIASFAAPGFTGSSIDVDDFTGDDLPDILRTTTSSNGKVVWFQNLGDFTFLPQQSTTNVQGTFRDLWSGDIDGDGDADVAWQLDVGPRAYYQKNDGNGNFDYPQLMASGLNEMTMIELGDMDNDGDPDCAGAAWITSEISVWENQIGEGCMDPSACNYDPEAFIDNASCCWADCGCTDPNANNFSSSATCDNLSCAYSLLGVVFFDEDENGFQTGEEGGIEGIEVTLQPGGWISYTNVNGEFLFNDLPKGSYVLYAEETPVFPFSTNQNPRILDTVIESSLTGTKIGFTPDDPQYNIDLGQHSAGTGYPCGGWVNHFICFDNNSSESMDGILEVTVDSLFQDYLMVYTIDSISDQTFYLSFEDILPGQSECVQLSLLTPDANFVGEWLNIEVTALASFDSGEITSSISFSHKQLTCAYDPNDKQVFPEGFAEPHFILPTDTLEYLIRFQNTGNAPATNVLVTDTIDANLDLTTFELNAASHSMITSIDPSSRLIEFYFEEIMLPDSVNNEPESHGFISYSIEPYNELEVGTEVNNTAYIFFDNNPPIVTNSTWNTIYGCSQELATIEGEVSEVCADVLPLLSNTGEYIESYSWFINGEWAGDEQFLTSPPSGFGIQEIVLQVENPLCYSADTVLVNVLPIPIVPDEIFFETCAGDELLITAPDGGESYLWSNGIENQSFVFSEWESESLTVEAFGENGCAGTTLVWIEALPNPYFEPWPIYSICPNGSVTMEAEVEAETVIWEEEFESFIFAAGPLETTEYSVVAIDSLGCDTEDSVLVTVHPEGDASFAQTGNLLQAQPNEFYQWLLDNIPIEGANEPTLEITEGGLYSLQVVNEWGCPGESEQILVIFDFVNSNDLTEHITLFPNPVQEAFTITLPSQWQYSLQIFRMDGALVLDEVSLKGSQTIHCSSWASGMYRLIITTNDAQAYQLNFVRGK